MFRFNYLARRSIRPFFLVFVIKVRVVQKLKLLFLIIGVCGVIKFIDLQSKGRSATSEFIFCKKVLRQGE